jgi:Anti-sigma-D factor RsdA to sigma factor binding region
MTTVHPRRPARRYGPDEDPAVAGTDELLEALSGRTPVSTSDAAVTLLAALIDDVDQRCSSVSITPST